MLVIVGGIMSLTMAASYIYPIVATVYIFSFVSGVGGAFLWVGQGAEVLANSNSSNIDYHSALFWFLYQISQFAGNLYVFFAWQGTDYINSKMRIQLYSILVGVGAFGLVCFAFIKLVPNEDSQEEENTEEVEKKSGTEKFVESLQSVKQAIKYCASAHFIQLMVSEIFIVDKRKLKNENVYSKFRLSQCILGLNWLSFKQYSQQLSEQQKCFQIQRVLLVLLLVLLVLEKS